jgi:hypothetical protein
VLLKKSKLKVLDVFENTEPPYDLQGEMVEMENLIVVANKL